MTADLVEQLRPYGQGHPALVWASEQLNLWRERVKHDRKYGTPNSRWSAATQKKWKDGII